VVKIAAHPRVAVSATTKVLIGEVLLTPAALLCPFARDSLVQRNLGAKAIDEGDAMIWIYTDLVRKPVAERPNH
jgi:hypothetical protein